VKIRNVKAYLAAEGLTAEFLNLGALTGDVSMVVTFMASLMFQKKFAAGALYCGQLMGERS